MFFLILPSGETSEKIQILCFLTGGASMTVFLLYIYTHVSERCKTDNVYEEIVLWRTVCFDRNVLILIKCVVSET